MFRLSSIPKNFSPKSTRHCLHGPGRPHPLYSSNTRLYISRTRAEMTFYYDSLINFFLFRRRIFTTPFERIVNTQYTRRRKKEKVTDGSSDLRCYCLIKHPKKFSPRNAPYSYTRWHIRLFAKTLTLFYQFSSRFSFFETRKFTPNKYETYQHSGVDVEFIISRFAFFAYLTRREVTCKIPTNRYIEISVTFY